MSDFGADRFNMPGYFVPEGERQVINGRNASAIMRVGVTNAARCYSNQCIGRPELGSFNFNIAQRFADVGELNSFHQFGDWGII